MGYTTTFEGKFTFDKPLTLEHSAYLTRFAKTRHMLWDEQITQLPDPIREAAKLPLGNGGAFFTGIPDLDFNWTTKTYHPALIDYNTYPVVVPGLWCKWAPNTDGTALQWTGTEKFYDYVEWLEFIVTNFTAPWGYTLNGSVKWEGEDSSDTGTITVTNNLVEAIASKSEEDDEAAQYSSENIMLRALLADAVQGINNALSSDAPAEVLEALRTRIQIATKN